MANGGGPNFSITFNTPPPGLGTNNPVTASGWYNGWQNPTQSPVIEVKASRAGQADVSVVATLGPPPVGALYEGTWSANFGNLPVGAGYTFEVSCAGRVHGGNSNITVS